MLKNRDDGEMDGKRVEAGSDNIFPKFGGQ
jgi:hypothetical protein